MDGLHLHFADWITRYGYAGLFASLVLGIAGLPIPDETILTFAGYLVYKGQLHMLPTLAVAVAGSGSGMTLSYGLGRTLGYRLLHRYGPAVGLTEDKLARTHDWFERIGKWTLTVGYFIPGVRHLSAFSAGASELEMGVFALFAYPGCLVWVATFLSLGYCLGEGATAVWGRLHWWLTAGAGVVVAALVLVVLARSLRTQPRGPAG